MTSPAPSSRRLLIVALAVGGLLVAGGLLWRRREAPPPEPQARSSPDLVPTVQRLLGELADDSDGAVDKLVALGEPAIPGLVAALNDPDDDRRARIVEVLEHVRSRAAVAPLLALIPTASSDVRIDAVTALGAIGDPAAVLPLQALYAQDESPQVRYEVLTSLGRIGDARSLPLLVEASSAPDPYARLWAIDALCVMQAPPAFATGVRLLDDPSPYVRRRVLRVCAPLLATPAADQAVVAHAVKDPDFETTVWARRVIAQRLADGTDRAALVTRMHGVADPLLSGSAPASAEQIKAVFLLAELRDGTMIDQLMAVLRNPDMLMRQHATFLLGQDGSDRALPGLITAMGDSQALVRQTARDALQTIAGRGQPTARAALGQPNP